MENKNNGKNKFAKGFTLIELLVVVLIIGILAAIALPQYKYAVLKSRYASVKQNTKKLWEANQRYYLVNNEYTTRQKDLDISVSSHDKDVTYYLNGDGSTDAHFKFSNNGRLMYYIYPEGKTLCLFSASASDQSVFNMLDDFCRKETNGGARGCNNPTYCYYAY